MPDFENTAEIEHLFAPFFSIFLLFFLFFIFSLSFCNFFFNFSSFFSAPPAFSAQKQASYYHLILAMLIGFTI